MKILNVMFTTRNGGLERAFLDYSDAINLLGHEIVQIIHKDSAITEDIKETCYKVGNFSKFDPIALWRLGHIVKTESPDFIITHGNRAHYMMTKVANSIPVIGVCHTYSFDYIKKCDYIISVSSDIRNQIIDSGYSTDKIIHIPNMITLPKDLHYLPKPFAKPPVIGVICRLDKMKGVDIFVESLHLLKEKKIKFKAMIAGDGDEYFNIKTLINKLKLDNNITMTGWLQDKTKFYNSVDTICIPSRVESFGLIILEAFSYSKPIIVSNLPGPMEIVENNKNALVFEAGNPLQLAQAIEKLIIAPEFANILTANGFARVQTYSTENIIQKIAEFLNYLTKQ